VNSEDKIDSLEGYFANLKKLVSIKENLETGERSGLVYTILPLEEPIFQIDANSRIIHVPNELKNIGVAGDHGAEILYFAIDRYFDSMDLAAEGINTVIDWRNPNNPKDFQTGTDYAYLTLINIPSYLDNPVDHGLAEKILIGWALGGNVMKSAGTVEFSIRFF
jgi:hypothetical protein